MNSDTATTLLQTIYDDYGVKVLSRNAISHIPEILNQLEIFKTSQTDSINLTLIGHLSSFIASMVNDFDTFSAAYVLIYTNILTQRLAGVIPSGIETNKEIGKLLIFAKLKLDMFELPVNERVVVIIENCPEGQQFKIHNKEAFIEKLTPEVADNLPGLFKILDEYDMETEIVVAWYGMKDVIDEDGKVTGKLELSMNVETISDYF